jgi:hypothetical protein
MTERLYIHYDKSQSIKGWQFEGVKEGEICIVHAVIPYEKAIEFGFGNYIAKGKIQNDSCFFEDHYVTNGDDMTGGGLAYPMYYFPNGIPNLVKTESCFEGNLDLCLENIKCLASYVVPSLAGSCNDIEVAI